MSEKATKCRVTALRHHTLDGKAYEAGDTYDVDEAMVESLAAQGMAKPSAEVEQDAKDSKAKKK